MKDISWEYEVEKHKQEIKNWEISWRHVNMSALFQGTEAGQA